MSEVSLPQRLAGLPAPRRELLERLLAARTADQYEASQAQRGLWFIDQLQPGSALYVVGWRCELLGALDPALLTRALNAVVARHQALRGSFPAQDGRPVLRIAPELAVPLPVDDLTGLSSSAQERMLTEIAERSAAAGFELRQPPLLRARLVRLAADRHVLVLCVHHIVFDGVSGAVMMRDLLEAYAAEAGHPQPRQRPAQPYTRFVDWQREQLTEERRTQLRDFWRDRLADAPALLEIPTGHTHPPVQSYRGATYQFVVQAAELAAMAQLASAQRCSPFMAYLAVLQALLSRYSGGTDICVGTAAANRPHPDLQEIVGLCANMVVMRTDLSGDPTFRQLLDRVREVCLDAYEHQDMPFDRLVEELAPDRNLAYNPLFQVACALEADPAGPGTPGAPTLSAMEVVATGCAKFDLSFAGMLRGDQITVSLEYRTDLFDEPVVAGMAAQFAALWRQAAAEPDLPLSRLLPAESAVSLAPPRGEATGEQGTGGQGTGGQGTAVAGHGEAELLGDPPAPPAPVHELVRDHAAAHPMAVALHGPGVLLTYQALADQVTALARRLAAAGAGPGTTAGISHTDLASTVVSLLAITATGAAAGLLPEITDPAGEAGHQPAVPVLDLLVRPAGPDALAVGRARDDGAAAGTVDGNCLAVGTAGTDALTVAAPGEARAAAGATVVTAESLARLAADAAGACRLTSTDAMAILGNPGGSGLAAGRFLTEVCAALAAGASCRLPAPGATAASAADRVAIAGVRELLRDRRVTAAWLPPRLWSLVRSEAAGLRVLVTEPGPRRPGTDGSDTAGPRIVVSYPAPHIGLVAAGSGSGQRLAPVAGVAVHILDPELRPAPIGIVGDLYVAVGADPASPAGPASSAAELVRAGKLRRVGDAAHFRPDGTVAVLGPRSPAGTDGFRARPWVTEAAIAEHPDVADVAVIGADPVTGLTAYVVSTNGARVGERDLRAFLADRLPPHLSPDTVTAVDEIPLTADWSVDTAALASASAAGSAAAVAHIPPATALQRVVVSIWQGLFEQPRIGVEDNFFDLGGHSLLAVQMLGALSELFRVELPLSVLFGVPTPAALAERLTVLLGGCELAEQTAQAVEAILSMSDEEAQAQVERLRP